MVSTPQPESAASQAAAQSGLNRDTALTQQQVNMVNQVTPDGNLTYSQNGTSSFVDSNGKTVSTPTYTATTTLSPEQQAIANESNAAKLNLGKLANQQSAALTDQLSKPFSYTNSDAEDYAYNLGKERLDPKFATDQDNLRTQLISSGIRPGTAAYAQQMATFGQTQNDAYDQLALGAQQQGYQQALTTYNEPLNAIGALTSGSQVSTPTFTSTPTASVSSPNYMAAAQANNAAATSASQAKLGGLFGLASAGIGLFA